MLPTPEQAAPQPSTRSLIDQGEPLGPRLPRIALPLAQAFPSASLSTIDTHVHADHRSSGRALAAATGAEYVLHTSADVAYPFRAVGDGERLPLGNVVVDVMHTPGHTPEHVCLLVTDQDGRRLSAHWRP